MGKPAVLLAIGLGFAGALTALAALNEDQDLNNGDDFTRPPPRFDLRFRFEDETGGATQEAFILRRDQPTPLGDHWELNTRIDLPFVATDKKSADNPGGASTFGVGDLLTQVSLIDSFSERFAMGVGTRFMFPTANADEFGTGKYRLLPMAGARWKVPEISVGSFFQLLARYDFDLGGYGDRSHISRFQFSPTLSVALPDRWFVTVNPSQDFAVNLLGGAKWFIPADFAVGRNLSDRATASLEVSVPIVRQYVLYDLKIEARFAFSF
jgi:hypothetical protein